MKKKPVHISCFWALAMTAAVFVGLLADTSFAKSSSPGDSRDSFYSGLNLLERTLQRIRYGYVTEIPNDSLIRSAIDGAIGALDPYTTFYEPKDFDELRIQTRGEFGGLGIQIAMRDGVLTIMTPIGGTPAERAGLRSGDRILRINDELTRDMSLSDAVDRMRGKPGTEVNLTISREGQPGTVVYTIVRDIIEIRAIPYAGIFNDSIGYIRLNSFSEDVSSAVSAKIDSLKSEGMKALIFDLRFNPGGLLNEAVAISDLFLPPNRKVVYTKGRTRNSNSEFHSRRKAVLPDNMPLLVMVNRASASASEIVAGAIQDWDRGVVVGDTTFGKGSVQTVLPVDQREERYIKITTAYYYTPSGRCINRPDRERVAESSESDLFADFEDEIKDEDTVAIDTFFTAAGRMVFGGGGVIPDTIFSRQYESYIFQKFLIRDIFFKFATYYYPRLEAKGVEIGSDFNIGDEIIDQFFHFADSIGFDYNTAAGEKLNKFKVYSGLDIDTTMDSLVLSVRKIPFQQEDSLLAVELIEKLDSLVERGRRAYLEQYRSQLEWHIHEALLVSQHGRDSKVVHEKRFERDTDLEHAIGILSDLKFYNSILKKR